MAAGGSSQITPDVSYAPRTLWLIVSKYINIITLLSFNSQIVPQNPHIDYVTLGGCSALLNTLVAVSVLSVPSG